MEKTHRTLNEEIDHAVSIMETFDRVHVELDEGKPWEEIDYGFRKDAPPSSYEGWYAYMQQRLVNHLRAIIIVRGLERPTPALFAEGDE